jgi:hypothetical protein
MKSRKNITYEDRGVRKKTRAGASRRSKGTKKYRGQGGPRKRVRQNCKPGKRHQKV